MQSLVSHGLLGFSNDAYVRNGHVARALEAAMKALDQRTVSDSDGVEDAAKADLLQLSGQLMMLLDRPDDALEHFEQCMKHVPRSDKGGRQARSCLISGLQCLERNQMRTAWNCLKRTLETKGVSMQVQVESCAAMAALFFSLGMRRPAETAVLRSIELLGPDLAAHTTPRAVLSVLRCEFTVLDLLRRHQRLDDLAFWPRHDDMAGGRTDADQALAQLADCRAAVASYGLLTARLDFLALLLRIAYGNAPSMDAAFAHIDSMNALGLGAYVHAARHELALACIAARQGEWLRRVMVCYTTTGQPALGQQHSVEHEYCLAKLGELNGRDDAYITHYRHYATQALIQVRKACAYITVPATWRNMAAEIVRDEMASRLPSRYRRAYQFILANLHRRDLAISEVAGSIGVTERALQLAFREHLGLSPSALIRQCRMERIRGDLEDGAVIDGATTLEVAQRWGVGSRSALSNGYQRAFGVAPSDTELKPA